MNSNQDVATDPAADALDGVHAIAAFLGLPERRVYELLMRRQLPGVGKIGGKYRGSKARLRAYHSDVTSGQA